MDAASSASTLDLLQRASAGDEQAIDQLFARYAPTLNRWASGRLPKGLRDIADTQDIVQDAMLQTFRNLRGFEYRGEGGFHAYLRQAILNRVKSEARKKIRRPAQTGLDSGIEADAPSPLELTIGQHTLARYEEALNRLSVLEREAVIARVELGFSYSEIAETLRKPSVDAARMSTARALAKLAELMNKL
jgi:RNA polymerase sigma-70 factor (ECF subfamily)